MAKPSKEFIQHKKSLRKEVKDLSGQLSSGKDQPEPAKPRSKVLSFPEMLSDAPIDTLGNYLGNYAAHSVYLEHIRCLKQNEIEIAKILLNKIAATIVERLGDKKKTEIDFVLKGDDFYVECTLELQKMKNDLAVIESTIENLKSYYAAVSREITNRKTQLEGRVGNFSGDSADDDGPFNTGYKGKK